MKASRCRYLVAVFVLSCLLIPQSIKSQDKFRQKADSIYNRISIHTTKDSTWFKLYDAYLYELSRIGQFKQMETISERCLSVADSLLDEKGRLYGYKWKSVANFYMSKDIDSAISWANTALLLAQKNNWKHEWIDQLNMLGLYYFKKGDFSLSQSSYLQSLEMTKTTHYPLGYAGASVGMGNYHYTHTGDYNAALQYYMKAAEYPVRQRTPALANIGMCFYALKEYAKSIDYFNQAIRESIRLGVPSIRAIAYNNKGNSFLELNKPDSARVSFEKGLATAREYLLRYEEGTALAGLGRVYTFGKQYNRALDYFQRASAIMEEIHFPVELKEYAYRTAMVYKEMNNEAQEKNYLNKALSYPAQRSKPIHKLILTELVELSEKENNFRAALQYQKQIGVLQDSSFNEQKVREAFRMEGKFQEELSKKEIETLEARNRLNENELARQSLNRKILMASVTILVIMVMLIVYAYLLKKNSNERLQKQNHVIEAQREELRASLESLQTVQAKLVQSEKMSSLGRLTAGIAHEINNPLNFISGGMEPLKHLVEMIIAKARQAAHPQISFDELKDDAWTLLKTMENGVDRVTKIVKSLNGFSSPQTDNYLDVLVEDVLDMSLTLTHKNLENQRVKVMRQCQPGLRVNGNASQLSQVFVNLINNAVDAMESNAGERMLIITTFFQDGRAEVIFTDNGSGIPEASKPHLFEPFYTTKTVGKGTGLGLSVSFGIIEKHGGKISFTSEQGKGSSFQVSLNTSGNVGQA
jgi:two-component system NtrC family sensor kinase